VKKRHYETYQPPFTNMADVHLRARQKGGWHLERITISEGAALRAWVSFVTTGSWGVAHIAPGKFVCLVELSKKERVVMSDTPAERRTNLHFVAQARGHVVIAGLGVGMVIVPLVQTPAVTHLTVVEKERDVIDLVEPGLRRYLGAAASKLDVIHSDVFDFTPSLKFDTVWFDIWPTIEPKHLTQIASLKRRFGRWYLKENGWMGAWCEGMLREALRTEKFLLSWWKRLLRATAENDQPTLVRWLAKVYRRDMRLAMMMD